MATPSGANVENVRQNLTESWETIRADGDIQFSPVEIPPAPPSDPSWLIRILDFLADLFSPVGRWLGVSWPVMQWALILLAIAAAAFLIYRIIGPMLWTSKKGDADGGGQDWQPDRQETLALLEDADRLAAEGRYDEATHLLLIRSIHQMALARPDWVEPSSTARELAMIEALPQGARDAFRLIADRVERSLFALRRLDQGDWQQARQAYANFALVQLGGASG